VSGWASIVKIPLPPFERVFHAFERIRSLIIRLRIGYVEPVLNSSLRIVERGPRSKGRVNVSVPIERVPVLEIRGCPRKRDELGWLRASQALQTWQFADVAVV
jgi:hypothetical protein